MTLAQELHQFIGTEHWYKVHPLSNITITDGVKYFADKGEAYWAVTDIISVCDSCKLPFICIEIVSEKGSATITYSDGDEKPFMQQTYPHTDLEQGTYKFYCTDRVLLLASEY